MEQLLPPCVRVTAVQNIIVYNNNMTFPLERGQFSRRSFIPDCSHFNFQSHVTHEMASGAQVSWCHRFMTLLPTQSRWHTYCVVKNTINLSCFLINCQPLPPPLVSCLVTWDQTSAWESRFCLFIKMRGISRVRTRPVFLRLFHFPSLTKIWINCQSSNKVSNCCDTCRPGVGLSCPMHYRLPYRVEINNNGCDFTIVLELFRQFLPNDP